VGLVHEEFPADIVFQDLDGAWTDRDQDGIFDGHGDLDLDLFGGRLLGDAARIRAYLDRNHRYRTGGSLFSERRFLSFVDDDWNGSRSLGSPDPQTTGRTWDLEAIYGDRYVRREWSDDTNRPDYLQAMAREPGVEFVYQWIHSIPQALFFDDNFTPNPENLLTVPELGAARLSGSFFQLFDCSASRFTEPDGNLASEYVHGEKGLWTIGSTKTGGIFNPEVLHQALRDGVPVGEALRLWFNDTWKYRFVYWFSDEIFDGWWLGMMVQGDPLLPIAPPAAIPAASRLPAVPRWSPEDLARWTRLIGEQARRSRVLGMDESLRARDLRRGSPP
jgi:hypothetical protein